jgi:tryptophanyl-tRNA synthetase
MNITCLKRNNSAYSASRNSKNENDMKPLIFSGIQPTGVPHLGNYLGALRNWRDMQDESDCIFCIVDLHAITVARSPEELHRNTLEMAASLLACGISPEKSILFNQSVISGHSELAWILGCHTPLGWLNRMTQFKEKAGKKKDLAVLGLYSYPVLQAADILLYKATHVPVGEDQKQHLELSRDIAGAFNRYVGEEFFPLPEPIILQESARVMSLRDGTNKMSKSDSSEYSRIDLTDSNDEIAQKIRKAKSDPQEGITYDPENRPEASNLLSIYAAITDRTVKETTAECEQYNFSTLKEKLTDVLVDHISPIRERITQLLRDRAELERMLAVGGRRAGAIAEPNMREIKQRMGFMHQDR